MTPMIWRTLCLKDPIISRFAHPTPASAINNFVVYFYAGSEKLRRCRWSTWMVFPILEGVASARMRSPRWALFTWLMLSWIPATLCSPDAKWAPRLAIDSEISADIPPCKTLNGWSIAGPFPFIISKQEQVFDQAGNFNLMKSNQIHSFCRYTCLYMRERERDLNAQGVHKKAASYPLRWHLSKFEAKWMQSYIKTFLVGRRRRRWWRSIHEERIVWKMEWNQSIKHGLVFVRYIIRYN